MKPIHYILICCLLALASGCGSSDSLANFSKRKYLKKPPKQKAVEQVYKEESPIYAGTELTISDYVLVEIPEIDYEQNIAFLNDELSLIYDNTVVIEYTSQTKRIKSLNSVVNSKVNNQGKSTWAAIGLSILILAAIIFTLLAVFGWVLYSSAVTLAVIIALVLLIIILRSIYDKA